MPPSETNSTDDRIPSLEELFNLTPPSDVAAVATQFGQNSEWDAESMPINLSEKDETTANSLEPRDYPPRNGIHKTGHTYESRNLDPYRIDRTNVHPETVHHIFMIRHGTKSIEREKNEKSIDLF